MDQMVLISYSTCDCEWVSDYCQENHQAYLKIPMDTIKKLKAELEDIRREKPLEERLKIARKTIKEAEKLLRLEDDGEKYYD